MSPGLGPRRVRRLLAVGPLALLLTFVPSVFYLDHWGEYLNHGLGHEAGAEPLAPEHETHCHVDVEGCGDQPAPPGPQGFAVVVELPASDGVITELHQLVRVLEGRAVAPLTEPPRSLARLS